MKRKFFLCLFLFLYSLLTLPAGCTKTEDSRKSGMPAAVPGLSHSTGAEEKKGLTAGQETAADTASSPGKASVPVNTLEKDTAITPPETPAVLSPPIPEKQAKKECIIVAGFDSAQMQKGVPPGWELDRREGTPYLKLEKGSDIYCLHMRSDGESSFGIKKGIKVDINRYPFLNWRWKVTRLPEGGDVRKSDTDDQAMQFYVAFTPTGFPAALNTPVLGYIWDNEAPKGWTGRSTHIGGGKLRYVVVRNNTDQMGQWHTEKRNIYEDYKKLFKDIRGGAPPGLTHGVQFHINSQNTASAAEGYICDIYFSRN
jgi:hypothetical protein